MIDTMNKFIGDGNLTTDPELKGISAGKCVANLQIAVNRSYKKGDEWEDEVSYFEVQVWGKLGEACAKNLVKGQTVRVEGRLKQDRWTDTEGKKRSKVIVIASSVEFGKKPNKEN